MCIRSFRVVLCLASVVVEKSMKLVLFWNGGFSAKLQTAKTKQPIWTLIISASITKYILYTNTATWCFSRFTQLYVSGKLQSAGCPYEVIEILWNRFKCPCSLRLQFKEMFIGLWKFNVCESIIPCKFCDVVFMGIIWGN